MPQELESVYRYSRVETAVCLFGVFFFLIIGILVHCACIACNPVFHDAFLLKKILMLVFIDGSLGFFVIFSLFATIYCHCYRLIFNENGVTQKGIRSVKTIGIPEITMLKWCVNRYKIKMFTPTTQITIDFGIIRRDKEKLKLLITFLRNSIPFDCQKGWKRFCYQMEQSNDWRDKNAIPVPDVSQSEILYTRKRFSRTIPWMIAGSCFLLIQTGYVMYRWHLHGILNDDAPSFFAATVFYVGVLWMVWGIVKYFIPKNGRIITKKHLRMEKYSHIVLGLLMFGFPFWMLILVRVHTNILAVLAIYVVVLGPFLPLYWMGHQRKKEVKQTIESLPDDYMPKIFHKT